MDAPWLNSSLTLGIGSFSGLKSAAEAPVFVSPVVQLSSLPFSFIFFDVDGQFSA